MSVGWSVKLSVFGERHATLHIVVPVRRFALNILCDSFYGIFMSFLGVYVPSSDCPCSTVRDFKPVFFLLNLWVRFFRTWQYHYQKNTERLRKTSEQKYALRRKKKKRKKSYIPNSWYEYQYISSMISINNKIEKKMLIWVSNQWLWYHKDISVGVGLVFGKWKAYQIAWILVKFCQKILKFNYFFFIIFMKHSYWT